MVCRGRDLSIYPLLKNEHGKVLDYGAGSGSLILNLAKENRFSEVFAVDLSLKALEKMEGHWIDIHKSFGLDKNKVKFICPENDQLSQIDSNTVDVVLTLDTLEHVLNPYTVLDELNRVTKKGGKLVLSVPNYGYVKHVVELFFGVQPVTGSGKPVTEWREAGWDGWHLHTFTRRGLDVLLRDCGWSPVKWTGYGDWGGSSVLSNLERRFQRNYLVH